jgi:hypothetical protein
MKSMQIHIHPDNSMLYITNKGPDRLDDMTFADLRLHLKKTFPNHELKYFHAQPVWTYGASELELRSEINRFLGKPND